LTSIKCIHDLLDETNRLEIADAGVLRAILISRIPPNATSATFHSAIDSLRAMETAEVQAELWVVGLSSALDGNKSWMLREAILSALKIENSDARSLAFIRVAHNAPRSEYEMAIASVLSDARTWKRVRIYQCLGANTDMLFALGGSPLIAAVANDVLDVSAWAH
jgi:hypothetical protein